MMVHNRAPVKPQTLLRVVDPSSAHDHCVMLVAFCPWQLLCCRATSKLSDLLDRDV